MIQKTFRNDFLSTLLLLLKQTCREEDSVVLPGITGVPVWCLLSIKSCPVCDRSPPPWWPPDTCSWKNMCIILGGNAPSTPDYEALSLLLWPAHDPALLTSPGHWQVSAVLLPWGLRCLIAPVRCSQQRRNLGVNWHRVTWPHDGARVHSEAWSSLCRHLGFTNKSPEQSSFHLSLHAFGPRPSGVRFSKAWPVTSLGHSPPAVWTAMRTGGRHPEYPELRFFILPFPSSGLWGQSPCLPLSVTGDASFRWKPYPVRHYRDW